MATAIKGGPDTEAQAALVGAKTKTITLAFSSDEELKLYARLSDEAAEDDRPLSKYILRQIKAAYSTTPAE